MQRSGLAFHADNTEIRVLGGCRSSAPPFHMTCAYRSERGPDLSARGKLSYVNVRASDHVNGHVSARANDRPRGQAYAPDPPVW